MSELALAETTLIDAKAERTLKLAGLSVRDATSRHRDLFLTAQQASRQVAPIKSNQLTRFYFTAAIAATTKTESILIAARQSIELDKPNALGGVIFWQIAKSPTDELHLPESASIVVAPPFRTETLHRSIDSVIAAFEDYPVGSVHIEKHQFHPLRSPRVSPSHPGIEPFRAFSDLKNWLNLTSTQLAELLGIKRTTPNAWKREGRTPREETRHRLYQLHSYVGSLAGRPDGKEQIARLRPALPILKDAIYSGAAIPSDTLDAAGVEIPFDWRAINAFQAKTRIVMDEDDEGNAIARSTGVEGMLVDEDDDEDDLELRY
jgi:hypothetical protein